MSIVQITVVLTGPVIDDIRRMTGAPDTEWLELAIGVYWRLLRETSDNVLRFCREDGSDAEIALTRKADESYGGGQEQPQ